MQKIVNGHLYVFDLTPFALESGTDADEIYVQNECVEGYKELNSDVADKIQGFNQFLFCVQKQEWSMPADPVDGGLEWSASTATVRIGDTNSYPTLINPNELEVTYSSSNESVATIDSTGAITLVGAGSTNITVESAAEPGFTADSASYALTVLAALVSPELAWSANSATVTVGADDNVFPTLSNPHNISNSLTYASSDESVATINAYGEIILVSAGETNISAIFVGDDTYYAQTVTYSLTVEASGSGSSDDQTYPLTINTQNFTGDEALYVEGVNNAQFDTEMYVPEGTHARIYVNNPENYVLEYDAAITAGEGPYTYNGNTYQDYILVFGWTDDQYDPETGDPLLIEGTMPAEDYTETFIYQSGDDGESGESGESDT